MINITNNSAGNHSQQQTQQPEQTKKSKYPYLKTGTIATLFMTIERGEYDDPDQGIVNGWASLSKTGTNAVYLKTRYVVTSTVNHGFKLFGTIPLYSPNGPTYGIRGREFIRSLINSARGIHPNDNSARAQALRRLHGFEDLDGIRFVAMLGVEDYKDEPRNVIDHIIEPDDPVYSEVFGAGIGVVSAPVSVEDAPFERPAWGVKS